MVSLKSLAIAAFAVLAAASPVEFDKRQSSSVRCGSKTYSATQLRSATNAGCSLHFNGQQIGSNKYPHTFNNREGLSFAVGGPYQEFPIISSGVYNGGSPGPDRVVFTPGSGGQCVYAGAITHTGASGNNFVSCV